MKTLVCFLILLAASVCSANLVQVTWDPNSETDLVGYKLYYRTAGISYNSPTPIEDIVPIYGPSPIVLVINCDPSDNDCINNDNPLFTLEMDLSDKDYWMVLTAYNNENESGFSNEVSTEENPINPPNGGGGSGGGCFINCLN